MYEFFRILALVTGWLFQTIFFKRKIFYEDKKEQGRRVKGSALIVTNHYNILDYVMNAFVFFPRKLYVVLSEWIFQQSDFFYWGMKFFGGICADRETKSMSFVDKSVETLEDGKLVQIFPEAHNTPDGEMHPFKPSYVLIALRSGAPIIPVITDGNYGIFRRAHIMVGKKIYLRDYCFSVNPSREEIERLNALVYDKCAQLRSELFRKTGKTTDKSN